MMNDIISGLLEFSGVDREKELILTDFNDVVKLVHLNLQTTLETNNAIVHAENLPKLNVYKVGMIQLLQNLIENAVKYSPDDPTILVKYFYENDCFKFDIIDNGLGINSLEKKKVFEKFYRVGSEETRKTKGTGLGLYIVAQVVKAHRGFIRISDNQPKGSIFHIGLPNV